MTDVVVVRPSTDSVEKTLSMWVDLLFPSGTSLPGVSITNDLGHGVTTAQVQAACNNCDVLLYFGHGTTTELGDPMLLNDPGIACASGATVVAVACESGKTLGPAAVGTHNVAEYLGFDEPLFLYIAQPALIGTEIAMNLRDFLKGNVTLDQARDNLANDLAQIQRRYRSGSRRHHPNGMLIWMGAALNRKALVRH